MKVQLLVAAVDENVIKLSGKMNINSDAIIINQSQEFSYVKYKHNGYDIEAFSFHERGVGLSRNNALMRADADIVLFADEDIVYDDDYRENVEKEFEKNPSADMILFNVDVTEDRKTYQIDSPGRVRLFNSGRYPTYSMAVKLDRVRSKNICFSLLFGGGAKYSNGEDSLFISDCIRRGLKVYKVPVKIGKEVSEKSSWFTGYNEKFFFDRGVLYHYLYGYLAKPIALRFLYKHKSTLCEVFSLKEAYKTMKKGILEAKKS